MAKVKDKERILKAVKERQLVTHNRVPIRLSANLQTETIQARRDWHEIFKVMKSKDSQPRPIYPARLSFKTERKIKSFSDKKKLK